MKLAIFCLLLLSTSFAYEVFTSTVVPIEPEIMDDMLGAAGDVVEDDHFLSFGTICRNKQYPFEQHKVRTYDGYFLTLFRIPGPKGEPLDTAVKAKRPPVLLWHDLLDSADTWIINDEDKAPGFILANQGYDVWFANSRGNKYSRAHRFLDPERELDEEKFFGFTYETMAAQDTNATVNYIRTETTKTNVAVIGHGYGATQFFMNPLPNVAVLVALSPMSVLNHTQERLIKLLAEDDYYITKLKDYKINEIFPANYLKEGAFKAVCQTLPTLCEYLLEDYVGADSKYINLSRLDEWWAHYPAGTSFQNLLYLVSLYKKEIQFKVGTLTNINTKVIILAGEEDHIAHPADVHWLRQQLGTKVIYYASYRLGHYSYNLSPKCIHQCSVTETTEMSYLSKVIELLQKNTWS